MGAGGLNGELRDNTDYIESVLHYHLRAQSGERARVQAQQTSNTRPFPSSSSSISTLNQPENNDMVCYSCSVNFTVFKRKQICPSCKRAFCRECFKVGSLVPNSTTLAVPCCLTCRTFAAPIAYKEFLTKIKIKDLQQYLRDKNVSTQHCKEKRELIELVLQLSAGESQNIPQSVPDSEPSPQPWQSYRSSASSGHYNVNSASTSNDLSRTSQNSENADSKPPRSSRTVMTTIDDLTSTDQISSLSVREIKHILTVNCVNYKGCLEKKELLQKVELLWNSKNESKKSTNGDSEEEQDSMCKICMDRNIDCVLLECGHMVSCLQCSKQVTECPICRQNVSRIVKVFKA